MNSLIWVCGLFVFSHFLFLIEYFKLKDAFAMQAQAKQKIELYLLFIIYLFSLLGILFHSSWVFPVIFAVNYFYLILKWKGNFNGGSDNMSFVLLTGLFIAKFNENDNNGLFYIALLVTSSYVLAGWAKAKNREWWT
ncbi:MAG: hypothetical protein ACK5V3_07330, partial [Bdellovibrionales bacterium]